MSRYLVCWPDGRLETYDRFPEGAYGILFGTEESITAVTELADMIGSDPNLRRIAGVALADNENQRQLAVTHFCIRAQARLYSRRVPAELSGGVQ